MLGFGVGAGWAEAANGNKDTMLAVRGMDRVIVRGETATTLANKRVRGKRISRRISMLELAPSRMGIIT